MAYEVIAVLFVIIAWASERGAEMIGSPLLEKYDINGSGIRTGVMVALVTLFNFALLWGLDVDPISALLEQNQSLINMGFAAFAASGVSGVSHTLQSFLGKPRSVTTVIQTGLDLVEELESVEEEFTKAETL